MTFDAKIKDIRYIINELDTYYINFSITGDNLATLHYLIVNIEYSFYCTKWARTQIGIFVVLLRMCHTAQFIVFKFVLTALDVLTRYNMTA